MRSLALCREGVCAGGALLGNSAPGSRTAAVAMLRIDGRRTAGSLRHSPRPAAAARNADGPDGERSDPNLTMGAIYSSRRGSKDVVQHLEGRACEAI
jgi:hypothetical protein